MSVALVAWWCCVEMKVICYLTVGPFYQLLLSSILVSEYWWQWNHGAVKTFLQSSCVSDAGAASCAGGPGPFSSFLMTGQHLCLFDVGPVKLMQSFQSLCELIAGVQCVWWTLLHSDFSSRKQWEQPCCFITPKLPGHDRPPSQVCRSLWTEQQCESHYTPSKLLWNLYSGRQKKKKKEKGNFSIKSWWFPARAWR